MIKFSFFLLTLCLSPLTHMAAEPTAAWIGAHDPDGHHGSDELTHLDESLARKTHYAHLKENQLAQLRSQLYAAADPSSRYKACVRLYDAYKSYRYDSAHVYASRILQLADQLGSPDYKLEARCARTFSLLSAGLYKEAVDEFHSVDATDVSTQYKKIYFMTGSRLYYDMADFNRSQPYHDEYVRLGGIYTDSLLHRLQPQSADWLYANAMRQMKEERYDESSATFRQLLRHPDIDIHTKAIVTSSLGWICVLHEDWDNARHYLAQAAVYDNESATREAVALCVLAGMLYKSGDIERATRYVQLSLDDANFYDARQRKIEIGYILPIIEHDRYNIVKSQRNTMVVALIMSFVAAVIMLLSILFIRRQMRKLQQARRVIETRNNELTIANNRLCEADKIKDEYIGRSFYLNAEYINKVEKLYKTIDRKITTRQYEDLRSSLKESTLNTERKSMFADFDETFLKLFPDFVERYNLLFDPSDRRRPEGDSLLTSEMRIFALIRLGVSDSERIAKFLNYSVHTVNTYKTRVKNRSRVENEEFEQRIMEI